MRATGGAGGRVLVAPAVTPTPGDYQPPVVVSLSGRGLAILRFMWCVSTRPERGEGQPPGWTGEPTLTTPARDAPAHPVVVVVLGDYREAVLDGGGRARRDRRAHEERRRGPTSLLSVSPAA